MHVICASCDGAQGFGFRWPIGGGFSAGLCNVAVHLGDAVREAEEGCYLGSWSVRWAEELSVGFLNSARDLISWCLLVIVDDTLC